MRGDRGGEREADLKLAGETGDHRERGAQQRREQRLYIAQHPESSTATERDAAIESIEGGMNAMRRLKVSREA